MNIARKKDTIEIKMSATMTAYEYPVMDNALHGVLVELHGRYSEKGRKEVE